MMGGREQRQRVTLLGVLTMVMTAVYVRACWRAPSPVDRSASTDQLAQGQGRATEPAVSSRGAEPPASPAVASELPLPQRSGQRDAQRQRAGVLSWGRDPFSHAVASSSELEGLVLSGIIWDATAPIAIINGQLLHTGEECEGYRIVGITQDHVSVSDGTDTFQLLITP